MLFGNDRNQIRYFYCEAWRKFSHGLPMEPLEDQVAAVIGEHPEYHRLLEVPEEALDRDYTPEMGQSNPFLHMGMHIAIREQLSIDRPAGIVRAYQAALARLGDAHELEHRMMECLAEMIWQAQRNGTVPDEAAYLECVRQL
jgi:hypothetical protein